MRWTFWPVVVVTKLIQVTSFCPFQRRDVGNIEQIKVDKVLQRKTFLDCTTRNTYKGCYLLVELGTVFLVVPVKTIPVWPLIVSRTEDVTCASEGKNILHIFGLSSKPFQALLTSTQCQLEKRLDQQKICALLVSYMSNQG